MLEKQNNPELLQYLKASVVAYRNGKRWENLLAAVLAVLAIAYPLAYLLTGSDSLRLLLFGCSFLLTTLYYAGSSYFRGSGEQGALLKEKFDQLLFNLPWKPTLPEPDLAEVSRLSVHYNGPDIKNWYPANITGKISVPLLFLICHRVNCGWDVQLRKNYCVLQKTVLFLYAVALGVLFVLRNADGMAIFSVCFSVQSFFISILETIRGHQMVIARRQKLAALLDNYITSRTDPSPEFMRAVQDDIYATRCDPAKVPDYFFSIRKKSLSMQFDEYISMINRKLTKA